MRHRGRWASFVIGGAALAALLFVFVPGVASGSGADLYTASVTPGYGVQGTSATYRLTITNDGESTDALGSAQITLPSNWTVTAAATTTPGWSATNSPQVVTMSGPGAELAGGASASVDITASSSARSSDTWSTDADSSAGFTFSSDGDFAVTGSDPVVITTGPATHLLLAAASTTPTAGNANNLTITALDSDEKTVGSYSGDETLTFSGANDAPDGTHPTVTDKTGTPVAFGTGETITFAEGVASVSGSSNGVMRLYEATAANVAVSDGTIHTVAGLSVTVAPAGLDHFTFASIGGQTAGGHFGITVTARDQYANTEYDYAGGGVVSGLQSSPAPVSQPPLYPSLSFTAGVASGDVTAFFANDPISETDNSQLTVSGGGKSGSSTTFKVAPAGLDHFTFASIGGQTAGGHFGITVTARDQYANTEYDYAGGGVVSGLQSSPAPVSQPPLYPSLSFTAGVASGDVTAFFANDPISGTDNSQLTVSGGGKSGSSTTFKVAPAGLDHFTFASIGGQTAGGHFGITVTARDQYANTEYDYAGGGVVSGLQSSPAPVSQPPLYPSLSFTAGVASGDVTAFFANDPISGTDNSQLTVSGGGKSGSSTTFKVAPAGLDHFTFANVSGQVAGMQFGVTVTGRDQYANTEYDYAGGGTLSGLQNSPIPVNQGPVYPSLSFTAGVASGNVKAYFANDPASGTDNSQLTVSGGGKSGRATRSRSLPAPSGRSASSRPRTGRSARRPPASPSRSRRSPSTSTPIRRRTTSEASLHCSLARSETRRADAAAGRRHPAVLPVLAGLREQWQPGHLDERRGDAERDRVPQG